MSRHRIRHWRSLILLACLAIALLDAKLDPARKSLTIRWKPTSVLRIDDGLRAIERGVAAIWKATPPDAGIRVTPPGGHPRAAAKADRAPAAPAAAPRGQGSAPAPKILDHHNEEDRQRLDQTVSGN